MSTAIWLPITVAAAVGGACYLAYYRKKKRPALERSWSFTSEGMRLGCFPESINAPPTVINAAIYYDDSPTPTVDDIAETVITPLLEYERFQMVPNSNGKGLRKSTNDYKPSDLVRTIPIANTDELHNAIVESSALKLDQDRNDLPWWEIVRIENLSKDKKSALVLRVHHCLGDGLSLVTVFDKILTSAQDGSKVESKVTKSILKRADSKPPMSSVLGATGHVLGLGASKFDDATAFRPSPNLDYTGNRKYLLFPTVSLQFVKQLKEQASATVNDILMFAISQAIYDYCQSVDDATLKSKQEKLQIRALLPASLPRSPSELSEHPIRNKWCMVSADLHVGIAQPKERLQAIHSTTTFMKSSPRAYVQLWVQNNVAPLLPLTMARQTTHDVFTRHSLVLTNVPGPERQCMFGKQPVSRVQMLFPNVIPQVSLLSYAGQVYGNIVYDPDQLKNGESFAAYYAKAFCDLAKEFEVTVPTELQTAAASVLKD